MYDIGDGGGRSLAEMLERMAAAQGHVRDLASGDGKLGAGGEMGGGGGLGTGRGIKALGRPRTGSVLAAEQQRERELQSQKRPLTVSKETYYSVTRERELQSQLRGFAPDDTQAARSAAAFQDLHRQLPSLVSPPTL